jgi:hypothetical protein
MSKPQIKGEGAFAWSVARPKKINTADFFQDKKKIPPSKIYFL